MVLILGTMAFPFPLDSTQIQDKFGSQGLKLSAKIILSHPIIKAQDNIE